MNEYEIYDLGVVPLVPEFGLAGQMGFATNEFFEKARRNLMRLADALSDQAQIINIMMENGAEWSKIQKTTEVLNSIKKAYDVQFSILNVR